MSQLLTPHLLEQLRVRFWDKARYLRVTHSPSTQHAQGNVTSVVLLSGSFVSSLIWTLLRDRHYMPLLFIDAPSWKFHVSL